MKKRLVIISPRFPYPLEKGDKLRMYNQIKSLSQHFSIYLIALSDVTVHKEDKQAIDPFCEEMHIYSINGKWNTIKGIFNNRPFQSSYFYCKSVHKEIQQTVNQINPHHIYYQLVRTAAYKIEHTAKKTIDLMDCFSKGYNLRAKEERGLKSWLYQMEADRLLKQENAAILEFDQLTVISVQDAESLKIADQASIIPNGIDTDYFVADQSKVKNKDVVFVGNLGYEPNVYAVEFLKNEIFPLVKKQKTGVQFSIAGARPVKRVTILNDKQFEIKGWVDDIRDAYNESKIFVAPIFGGIGQQNKVLEAMAMQLPCIVSPAVAKGLDIENIERFLIIADTGQAFADSIIKALSFDKELKEMIANALQYVQGERSWEGVNKELSSLLGN